MAPGQPEACLHRPQAPSSSHQLTLAQACRPPNQGVRPIASSPVYGRSSRRSQHDIHDPGPQGIGYCIGPQRARLRGRFTNRECPSCGGTHSPGVASSGTLLLVTPGSVQPPQARCASSSIKTFRKGSLPRSARWVHALLLTTLEPQLRNHFIARPHLSLIHI